MCFLLYCLREFVQTSRHYRRTAITQTKFAFLSSKFHWNLPQWLKLPTNSNCFLFPFRVQVTRVLLYFVMIGDRFIRSLELFLWFQSAKSFAAQSVNKATVVHESFATCLIIKHNYSCGNFSLIIQHYNIILNQWSAITQSLYIFYYKTGEGKRAKKKK